MRYRPQQFRNIVKQPRYNTSRKAENKSERKNWYSAVLSTLAIVISLSSLFYNVYKDYINNKEYITLMIEAPSSTQNIEYISVGDIGIICGITYDCIISNSSNKKISIIGYQYEAIPSSHFPIISYSRMLNGFSNENNEIITFPFSLDSGEAKRLKLNMGVVVSSEAHKLIQETYQGNSILDFEDVRTTLANNGIDFYGNPVMIEHYGDGAKEYVLSYSIKEERFYPKYNLKFISAKDNEFEVSFTCNYF